MSVTIDVKKLKFHVLGNGFDNVRNDSGSGIEPNQRHIGYGAGTACIDSSGTYFWITQNSGETPLNYLAKCQVSDLEQVAISNLSTNVYTLLFHPSNVENNYGVAFQNFGANCNIYVFDLTDDTIYHHITTNLNSFYGTCDCIMVGDDFYFGQRGLASAGVYKLDTVNGTFTLISNVTYSNGKGCGFVDNNTLYGFNSPAWFSDQGYRSGFSLDGATQWEVYSVEYGDNAFKNCQGRGLCGNGFIWLPSKIDGVWKWGKYDGNNAPDFETPSPIKVIGNFGNTSPAYTDYHVYYTDKRKRSVYYSSALGMMVVDFEKNEVETIIEESWKPLAISDRFIIATSGNISSTDIFRYR